LQCLQRDPDAVQQIDETGFNCLHYLARYHGRKTKVLSTACSGSAGRAAARAVYKGKTGSGLLPLHLLCRYHAREEASVKVLVSAYPEAVKSRDDQGCSCLHFAAANFCSAHVLSILLEHHAAGAHETDVAGYLPLHYFALRCGLVHHGTGDGNSLGTNASQREQAEQDDLLALRVLIEANKDALMATTRSGLLPLDCLGSNDNATDKMLRLMLDMQ